MTKTLFAAGALLLALSPAASSAQTPPVAPAATAGAAKLTTADTTIGDLIANPAAKAVIEKHFPGLTTADSIQMASGMTMRQLQQFKPDMFTDAALAATDADLAKLPSK